MIRNLRRLRHCLCAALCGVALFAAVRDAAAAQASFATPEDAVAAMVDALRHNDGPLLNRILGSGADALLHSGDAVQDQRRRASFLKAYDESHHLASEGDNTAVLQVGKDAWPMPFPLVKSHGKWHFDATAGKKEILARRIGRNELAAIQVCLAIVDAEREYATLDIDGDGMPEYAARIVSTPGRHDGLYWEAAPGERPSPLGPFLAAAADRGYSGTAPLAPYHGYSYRILTSQGKNAPGGARNYMVRGKMIGGFAAAAYPARYGISGVMSFLVNQDGVVYQKDLGSGTAAIARKIKAYDRTQLEASLTDRVHCAPAFMRRAWQLTLPAAAGCTRSMH